MKTRDLYTGQYYSLPKDQLIYIASPYSTFMPEGPSITERYKAEVMKLRYNIISSVCAEMSEDGYLIYSPVAMWHPIAVLYKLPKGHEYWERLDNKTIAVCEIFLLHPLYEPIEEALKSKGVQKDIRIARKLNKTILVPC